MKEEMKDIGALTPRDETSDEWERARRMLAAVGAARNDQRRLEAAAPYLLAALRELLAVDVMAANGGYVADRAAIQERARRAIIMATQPSMQSGEANPPPQGSAP